MEAIAPLFIVALFVGALILERIFPARPLPRVKGWLLKGIGFFILIMAVSGIIPALLAEPIGKHAPLQLQSLGLWGALPAFLVSELVAYWVHRAFHRFPNLWRWTHQLHHSAERLDVAGSVMFHPFDMVLTTVINVIAVGLIGVTADAAALSGMVFVFYAVFQHLNMKTPTWIGWLIQRPESHSIHHARGVHAYNYADLPIFDMLFGTYRNPEGFVEEQGFYPGGSARLGAMLLGNDVGEPPAANPIYSRPMTAVE